MLKQLFLLTALVLTLSATSVHGAPVTLVSDGRARVSVVLPAEAAAVDPKNATANQDLLHLRWAAEDLATYLKKMSGAEIPVGGAAVGNHLPIYVGSSPENIKMTKSSDFGDAYLIDVNDKRIVLQGESSRAIYYAAAHLLESLGVRWYAPEEMGEHVPQRRTLVVQSGRMEEAPHYQTRNLWGSHPAVHRWLLRNRMGGPALAQGHVFEQYMQGGKFFEEHPEYYPIVGGKPVKTQANLSNPKVVEIFANAIAEDFRKGPTAWAGGKAASIDPDDAFLQDDRPESLAMESGEMDPLLKVRATTDRLVKFVNAVAARLEPEFPNHTLGFYIYSDRTLPPRTVKLHRNVIPVFAPITFNRYTSIGNPVEPTSMMLKQFLLDWKAASSRLGVYLYNFNLADTAMPYTRRLAWSKDIPQLYKWGIHDASLESFAENWHAMTPGNYIIGKLMWNTNSNVDALLDEFYREYYGPAGPAMRAYNTTLETAYETTPAYAGNLWSMHRILTPAVMQKLEASLQEAERRAKGNALLTQRVEVTRFSLNFAKHWFAARNALNTFQFAEAAAHSEAFKSNYRTADAKYPLFFSVYNESYYDVFHHRSFADAGRVAKESSILYRFPDEWTAFLDDSKLGQTMGLHLPAANTANWLRLKTYSASLDEQGYPFFRGLIWYRHDFTLPKAASAGTLKLWFGGLDATTHVYLNGKSLGSHPVGNFGPLEVDVTQAINRSGRNTLVVAVDNTGINELGTGGIVRPVALVASNKSGSDLKRSD